MHYLLNRQMSEASRVTYAKGEREREKIPFRFCSLNFIPKAHA